MTKRCEIIIRVVDKKGEAPCHHGHVKGMELSWDHDRGRLCPMAQHALFPYIDILRYGGTLPGMRSSTSLKLRCEPIPPHKKNNWMGLPLWAAPFH